MSPGAVEFGVQGERFLPLVTSLMVFAVGEMDVAESDVGAGLFVVVAGLSRQR